MGYAGIKIAGHSGTDFKHIRVFTQSKKLLNDKLVISNVIVKRRKLVPSYFWFSRIKVIIVIVFLSTLILLFTSYYFRINNIAIHHSQVHPKELQFSYDLEKIHAAKLMYNSAKSYYASGALDDAQDEMIRVLKLYPTNLVAIQLMYNSLMKQCEIKNKHCELAQAYRKYMSKQ